ncbi:MAG: UDP-N-acetylmuramoyl-tripeptide--D-alanyl-D-alanine ligase [Gaiellales bacterium]
MIPLSLEWIAQRCPGELRVASGVTTVSGLEIDSRRVSEGDLFVAIGAGASFVDDALARGASAALVPAEPFASLATIGTEVRAQASATVVAITGSVGKTSTKDILAGLCGAHRATVAAEASHNNEIGVPLTLSRLTTSTRVAVLEMGMRGVGQIGDLCRIARPHVGVITSIGPAHLELLGTIGKVAEAKAELLSGLEDGGTAVVPVEEPLLEAHLGANRLRRVTFGDTGDVALEHFEAREASSTLAARVLGQTVELDLPFTSRHNADNAIAALAAYAAVGLPLDRVQEGAGDVELSPLRDEEIPLRGGGLLVNDCYNANPISMRAALQHLAARCQGRRRVAILGDMAELGPRAPDLHRELGGEAARVCVDRLVVIGSHAEAYADGYRSAGGSSDVSVASTLEEGISAARRAARPGDCILVKGSRAAGLEALSGELQASLG